MPRKKLPAKTVQYAVDHFFASLPKKKNGEEELTPGVIQSKRRTLEILVNQLNHGGRTSTRRLTADDFLRARNVIASGASDATNDWRRRNRLAPRTGRSRAAMRGDIATLKQFAKHLRVNGWADPTFDPLYEITRSTKDEESEEVTEIHEFKRIPFKEWARLMDCAMHPRDRLFIALGLYWARRASDLNVMNWGHIDFEAGTVQLFNKKKGRRVASGRPLPLADAVRAELERYLAWFAPLYGQPQPDWPLFPAKADPAATASRDPRNYSLRPVERMRDRSGTDLTKDALGRYGWTDSELRREGAHTLRRSGGEEWEERGGPAAAQMIMDHRSMQDTMRYTGNPTGRRALGKVMQTFTVDAPEPTPTPEPEPDTPMAPVVDLFSRRRVA